MINTPMLEPYPLQFHVISAKRFLQKLIHSDQIRFAFLSNTFPDTYCAIFREKHLEFPGQIEFRFIGKILV